MTPVLPRLLRALSVSACLLAGSAYQAVSAATEYFVGPNGNNTNNPGTNPATPLATIRRALQLAVQPGDIVTVQSGTYWNVGENRFAASGTEAAPITLRGEPGGQVVLKGSTVVTDWSPDTGAIYRAPWTSYYGGWSAAYSDTDPSNDPTSGYQGNGKGLNQFFVDGALLEEVPTYALLKPGSFYINPSLDLVYVWLADNSSPVGKLMEGTNQNLPIIATWGRSHLVIRDLTLMHLSGGIGPGLIRVSEPYGGSTGPRSEFVTLDNVKCYWSSTAGLHIQGSHHVVRNSEFNDNGWCGIQFAGASYGLFEDIKNLRNNTHAGKTFSTGWESSFKVAGGTKYAVFNRLESAYNVGQGFWIDGPSNHYNTLKNSHIHHNTNQGVRLEICYTTTVVNNLIHDNGESGIEVSAAIGNRIYNNVIFRNQRDAVTIGSSRTWPVNEGGVQMSSYANVVYNNIAYDNQLGNGRITWYIDPAPADISGNQPGSAPSPSIAYAPNFSDYNVFYLSPAYPRFSTTGSTQVFNSATGLADYQTNTGFELHSVYLDPRFVAYPTDLRLAANSLVRGMGTDLVLPEALTDIEGFPREAGSIDPGAYQSAPTAGWISRAPEADTHVINDTSETTNNANTAYGASSILLVETKGGTFRKAYLRFPVSTLAADAALELYTQEWTSTAAVPFRLYGIPDGHAGDAITAWTETGPTGLTYNNAPLNALSSEYFSGAAFIDSFTIQLAATGTATKARVVLRSEEIANFINGDTNGYVTFMLVREKAENGNYNYNANTRFYSDETLVSGVTGPRLLVREAGTEPLEDTNVAEFNPTNPYGTSTVLRVRNRSTPGVTIRSYLKFDVGGFPSPASAKLRLVVARVDGGTRPALPSRVQLYRVDTDNWSEDSMTWNVGQPALGSHIADINVTHAGQIFTIDVGTYAAEQAATADGIMSLALIQPSWVNREIQFSSSESGLTTGVNIVRPVLVTE